MLQKRERRAFWLFLLWMASLPFLQFHNLSAQEEELILDAEPAADAPAPGNAPAADGGAPSAVDAAGQPAASDTVAADPQPGDPAAAEGEVPAAEPEVVAGDPGAEGTEGAEGQDPATMPALSADPNMLLGKVTGLSKAGKHKEVIAELQDFEDAVIESNELLAIYVEALIKIDKPDWNNVNRLARVLGSKDNSSSLANYAQGLYWENSKKPDMGKAVGFYGKARDAKKPYPDAAKAYYIGMLKRFWYVLLIVIALPIVAVVQKKKKQKAAQLVDLNLDLNAPAAAPGTGSENPSPAAAGSERATAGSAGENAASQQPAAAQPAKNGEASQAEKQSEKNPAPAATEKASAAAPVTRKVVKVVRKVKAATKAKGPEEVEEIIEEEPAPPSVYPPRQSAPAAAPQSFDTITSKHQAEIERIRELTRPERRPSVQADPELDILWGNLSRKAMQGRISPQYRRGDAVSAARGYSAGFGNSASSKDQEPDFNTSDVSIDLSDEALRDDLIGKLKMLAISDGELRELFSMKNAAHIPHLIEYIMTRPEPLRLAFVAREIGHYGDPAVIDTLASLLYHEDERVALAAINGLENSKKPAAVMHLCPFLQSELPILAQAARTALLNFGAVKILQAFKNLPEHSDEKIRVGGVFVLSRMKGNAVEELLKKMLHDDSLEVRTKTILAMSYQKNPVYIEPLREFFRIATEADKAMARKAIVYLQGFVARSK